MSKLLKSSGTRLHVVFLDQDISRLDSLVAAHRGSRLTRSDLIRNIVHTYLNRVDEKTNERAKHAATGTKSTDLTRDLGVNGEAGGAGALGDESA